MKVIMSSQQYYECSKNTYVRLNDLSVPHIHRPCINAPKVHAFIFTTTALSEHKFPWATFYFGQLLKRDQNLCETGSEQVKKTGLKEILKNSLNFLATDPELFL